MNKKISTSLKTISLLIALPLAVNAENHTLLEQNSSKFIEITGGIAQPTTIRGNIESGSTDPKYVGGISLGKKISEQVSLDFGIITTSNTPSYYNSGISENGKFSWKNKSTAAMLNVSFDLTNDQSAITPYIKLGAGISRNKSSDYIRTNVDSMLNEVVITTYKGKSKNSFAWQVGAGFNIKTHSKFDIQLQYMFANLGKTETQKSSTSIYSNSPSTTINGEARKGKLQHHTVTIGIKFKI